MAEEMLKEKVLVIYWGKGKPQKVSCYRDEYKTLRSSRRDLSLLSAYFIPRRSPYVSRVCLLELVSWIKYQLIKRKLEGGDMYVRNWEKWGVEYYTGNSAAVMRIKLLRICLKEQRGGRMSEAAYLVF